MSLKLHFVVSYITEYWHILFNILLIFFSCLSVSHTYISVLNKAMRMERDNCHNTELEHRRPKK